MRILNLRPAGSKHCFMLRYGKALEIYRGYYNRPNAILKVFDLEPITKKEDFKTVKWGDDPKKGEPRVNTTLWEATQIQNIMAFHGLAPRVYALVTVGLNNQLFPAQLTEEAGTEDTTFDIDEAESVYKHVVALGKDYGFGIQKEDVSAEDVVNAKLVDFQTFAFTKPYEETVKERYIAGKYGKVYYQDVPELGLSGGPRKTEQRYRELQLEKVNFQGKTVLDIGCAGGSFLRYATNKGASRCVGVDEDKAELEAAFHVANMLGQFNTDFIHLDVTKDKIDGVFDITFFLSLNYHVGYPSWIMEATKELLIFEDNGKESRNGEKPEETISKRFGRVEYVGKATDHGNKPIYHLYKENK